jgi:hypothetical protein
MCVCSGTKGTGVTRCRRHGHRRHQEEISFPVTGAAADLPNALTVYHPILQTYINCSLTDVCVGSMLQVSWEQLWTWNASQLHSV